ncbi:hypothetical protein COCC4DRAFT_29293 [Bipolaris maydis ATCC 48331]|uniref:Uncharacterized protein n=2 Tax=Cochliobolus heterostrophus TaxID=5016 RepID=M2V796_COCH5|nr:uncharacterized protein COCC4DRAFT_29293 [Bipolaris maydis ATCC 48331]EMD95608.1 hypothetical protein COCHEDRAFT_1019304 [Bipolaris maydis C5]ENI10469.1 hypothetical protein COCC4DRAFT_29293 [Bipolaris maydis ATCC 48331]
MPRHEPSKEVQSEGRRVRQVRSIRRRGVCTTQVGGMNVTGMVAAEGQEVRG